MKWHAKNIISTLKEENYDIHYIVSLDNEGAKTLSCFLAEELNRPLLIITDEMSNCLDNILLIVDEEVVLYYKDYSKMKEDWRD